MPARLIENAALPEVYRGMLEAGSPRFAEIVGLAAEVDDGPLLLHCTVGKDRTGVAIATLLLAAGWNQRQ